MNKVLGIAATVLAGAALAGASAAEAKTGEEGWRAWTERATAIDAALKQTEQGPIKAACSGVTGTVIGQGFAFPYWGQSLMKVCQVSKDLWLYRMRRSGMKRWCGDIKDAARAIGKATPVPEGPGAAEVALDISATMMAAYNDVCK